MKRSVCLGIALCACLVSWPAFGQQPFNEVSSVRPVSLSVVSDGSGMRTVSLELDGSKAGNFEQLIDIGNAGRKIVEFFFTCLTLPEDKFWVNLNPGQPESVSDNELSRTDLGKILLAADLRLKKDTSELTNPRHPLGRQYWERLYAKAATLGLDPSFVPTRVWVGAGDVSLREAGGGVTITGSKLKVYLRQESETTVLDPRQKELLRYAGGMMQELIVPALEKRVNEHYAYWELREVFNTMILARWFKQNADCGRLPREQLRELDSDYGYSVRDIYRDYMESLKKGEYSLSETRGDKLGFYMHLITRNYVSGGMDFRKIESRSDNRRLPEKSGVLRYSCVFPLTDHGQGLSLARNAMRLVFPWSGINPDIFLNLPGLGRLDHRVEEGHGRVFLNSL